MALWTFFGLASGKATTDWPGTGEDAGQQGVLGMPDTIPQPAARDARNAPRSARRMRSRPRAGGLAVDYGRCVVCQLAPKPVRPMR